MIYDQDSPPPVIRRPQSKRENDAWWHGYFTGLFTAFAIAIFFVVVIA